MYSKNNIDVTIRSFRVRNISTQKGTQQLGLGYRIFIRGSSTGNVDSAHVEGSNYNYVSYYIKSIKFKYDTGSPNQVPSHPSYFCFFKLPYKDDNQIREIVTPQYISNIKELFFYSHPESVLGYDVFKSTHKRYFDSLLTYRGNYSINIPFILLPNEVVGIVYYNFTNDIDFEVNASVEFEFKPL